MSQQRRKRILVDHQVQRSLLLRIVGHWVAAAVASLAFLTVMQVFGAAEQLTLGEHAALLWEKYGVLVVVVGTLTPVFLYDTLKLSHRFAGPMVSFRKALADLAKGESIQPIDFRQDDFWKDIAENLNSVAAKMGQQNSEETDVA